MNYRVMLGYMETKQKSWVLTIDELSVACADISWNFIQFCARYAMCALAC